MSERVRERKPERKPAETVSVGPPTRLVRGLSIALDATPSIYEKDVEKNAKIAIALLMYYDPSTDSWYPASSPRGTPESVVKGYKPDTNTYEYLRLDPQFNLYTTIRDAAIDVPTAIQKRFKDSLTLFSGTTTASGNTADIDVSRYSSIELILKVTAVSGTSPVLSVYIEGKFTATNDYKTLVYQENISSTGIWFFTISQLAFRYIRVRWVVGGTSPSFTFTVAGEGMA